MTIADDLRAAKARLIERGWCQGDEEAIHGGPDRRCCAATAIRWGSSSFTSEQWKSCESTHSLFRKANGIAGNVADWNDAPERTLDEVLAAYDKAIAAAEEAGK